jgi:3-methylfumaryl-CoA hydratase
MTGTGPGAFAAILDTSDPGPILPPLWHWFEFGEIVPTSELGHDGHPREGGFLPPIGRRHRIWGGYRFRLHSTVLVGDVITRRSEIASVAPKLGSSGELLIVTERHEYVRSGNVVGVDEFDIIYRVAGERPTPTTVEVRLAPAGAAIVSAHRSIDFVADPALLFRFSALTNNAHRIHYDAAFAVGVEGHRDIVVHGPLLALLAVEVPRRRGRRAVEGRVTMRRPAFVGERIHIEWDGGEGVAATVEGSGVILDAELGLE